MLTDFLVHGLQACAPLIRHPVAPPRPSPQSAPSPHPPGPHLPDQTVPHVVDLLAVPAVDHQVQVVGELDVPGDPLQDVDAETLAALFDVGPTSLGGVAVGRVVGVEGQTEQGVS